MKPQAEESELHATDVLLMLGVVAGLAFALLLQVAPQPDVVLDEFANACAAFLYLVLEAALRIVVALVELLR